MSDELEKAKADLAEKTKACHRAMETVNRVRLKLEEFGKEIEASEKAAEEAIAAWDEGWRKVDDMKKEANQPTTGEGHGKA
jgi:chromosome segregation ATPase